MESIIYFLQGHGVHRTIITHMREVGLSLVMLSTLLTLAILQSDGKVLLLLLLDLTHTYCEYKSLACDNLIAQINNMQNELDKEKIVS